MSVELNPNIELKWWTFPGGERSVRILQDVPTRMPYTVKVNFKGSDDLVDMMLLANAFYYKNPTGNLYLNIPYFPFARQDRVMSDGEPFALQVAVNMIKACNFKGMTCLDPHSDVLAGMFEPGFLRVIEQVDGLKELVAALYSDKAALVSPDAGALKKIYKLAREVNMPVIEARKVRNVLTGAIGGSDIDVTQLDAFTDLIVVDDICDGGRTFIELAKVIKFYKPDANLHLVVTHGIFSQGFSTLQEYYTTIQCRNPIHEYR